MKRSSKLIFFLILRKLFENLIKKKHRELVFRSDLTFSRADFLQETENFRKRLQKKIHSFFYITEEQFDLCAFSIFKKEFFDFADLFLSENQKLTRICLMKRDHHVFVRGMSLQNPEPQQADELLLHKKHLDYIDHPIKLWNDLDVKIKNYFVERYIGTYLFINVFLFLFIYFFIYSTRLLKDSR